MYDEGRVISLVQLLHHGSGLQYRSRSRAEILVGIQLDSDWNPHVQLGI